jgi:hypothetical protein
MRLVLLSTVAVVLAFSGAAQAAIIQATLVGTITSGIDNQGQFGAPGSDLTGLAVTLSFSWDTALLSANGTYFTDGSTYELYDDYTGDTAVSESLTINSETYTSSVGAGSSSLVYLAAWGSGSNLQSAASSPVGGYIEPYLYSSSAFSMGQILDPAAISEFLNNLAGAVVLFDNGDQQSRISADLAPAPEPATWASLILGICCMALLQRRRDALSSGKS